MKLKIIKNQKYVTQKSSFRNCFSRNKKIGIFSVETKKSEFFRLEQTKVKKKFGIFQVDIKYFLIFFQLKQNILKMFQLGKIFPEMFQKIFKKLFQVNIIKTSFAWKLLRHF